MKITKKSTTFRLKDLTRERLKEMAKYLQHSEAEVIEFLVDSYYKNKTKKGFHCFDDSSKIVVTAKQMKALDETFNLD